MTEATVLFIPVGPELIVILLLLVLLFGANKIPEMARAIGSSTGEFKKGRKEIENELQEQKTKKTTTNSKSTNTGFSMKTESNSNTDSNTSAQKTEPQTQATETPTQSTSEQLERVKGIGPTYSDRLQQHEITTIKQLTTSTAEEIASAANVSETVAEKWIQSAETELETN